MNRSKYIRPVSIFTTILAGIQFAACSPCSRVPSCDAKSLAAVDYTPLAGDWAVSTAEAQGLDRRSVAQLYCTAARLEKIYSVLIVKDGFLVAEEYFNGGSINQKVLLQSVTKSYTSALVGIALKQGCLASREQKMLDFFPEVADRMSDPRKLHINIEQMLQMRGGYPWEETDAALWNGLLSVRYVPLIESFPLTAEPGATFQYSNLTSNWLGIILNRACGQRLKAFGEEHLFSIIDVEAGEWGTDWDGHNNGCGDLRFTARDAARFGQLYLDGGLYKGQQVVPADWVRDSLTSYSEHAWDNIGDFHDIGYGYHWWAAKVGAHPVNFAWGHGGQLIVLVQDLNMVVVVTAYPFHLEHNGESWCHERAHISLVGKFISSLPRNGL